MIDCSVGIVTYNSARTIASTLQRLRGLEDDGHRTREPNEHGHEARGHGREAEVFENCMAAILALAPRACMAGAIRAHRSACWALAQHV